MDSMDLRNERREYERSHLVETDVPQEPIELFSRWFEQWSATGRSDATAMTLATTGADGEPDARIVLLKGVEQGRFIFFTNYKSQKGKDIAENPKVCLMFFWPDHERQVRVFGKASPLTYEENSAYFKQRPVSSQVGAVTSPQSSVIEGRSVLEDQYKANAVEYGEEGPECPDFWGGYGVVPERVEFWQGRASRLHDRLQYRLDNGSWKLERLAP